MGTIQVNGTEVTPGAATDADVAAGIRGDVFVTPANLKNMGTIPISGNIYASKTIVDTTRSVYRLIRSELILSPTGGTLTMSPATDSLAAVRGCTTLTSGDTLAAGFLYGVQGKIILDGDTVAIGSGHVAGVYAQLSASAATITSGHVAIIIASGQNLPASANIDGIYIESGGHAIHSALKAILNADYGFDFAIESGTQGGWKSTSSAVSAIGTKGYIKFKVDGADRYIGLSETAS